ncbi:MAG: flavodoxin-dependent (E)-4-hydroxy-3-methylbut-2-enyl-diphosphate synthase [Chloroflexi bacterium]|nr:flavodoxin-dependent (E)-4-hydroxy-3-methylbut-2-enyl-diphosphate synthase [Chloroflexota bacterium]
MTERRVSRAIRIGDVTVGGGVPVVVQSMAKTHTADVRATVEQVKRLEACGCEIIRVAVPDSEAAGCLSAIKKGISIPLVADIHFDHRLALAAIKGGVDGLRLNPGNISDPAHVAKVVRAAKERQVPIRVGVNGGSLPKTDDESLSVVTRMVQAAMGQIKLLEDMDFDLIKVSLKAFDVPTTVEAYKTIAGIMPYPLHLGITESGTPGCGSIRSAVGIGAMLYLGLGDTIRVSLTGDPTEEVAAAYEILKSLNLRVRGPTMVSCPTCGRTEVDLISLAQAVEKRMAAVSRPIKVAVMGCVVNGPGEAKDADLGIACGRGRGAIFRKGELICTVDEKDLVDTLMAEVDKLVRAIS